MDRFTAMQVFTEIAERGSLTDTAEALDMSRAMVSRYLESLEQWLGARLLHRTTRRVSLTDAGAEALPRCRQALALVQDVQAVAGARQAEPRGRLRITASTSFAQAQLAAAISEFLALYPQTQVELIATERSINLVEDRIDLAVRIGNTPDPQLLARPLGLCRSVLCASPAYLAQAGLPATPQDLKAHRCLTHAYVSRHELLLRRDGHSQRVALSGPLQSNEAVVLREAALAGAGIALLPTYYVGCELAQGRLQRVLPEWEPEALAIHALYLSRQHTPPLLRRMVDFLAERFGGDVAPWDRPLQPAKPARRARTRS